MVRTSVVPQPAPMACTSRPSTSVDTLSAKAEMTLPIRNRQRPESNTGRRP